MATPRGNDICGKCDCSLHLQYEIEGLKQQLLERERHIVSMETTFLAHAQKFPNGELAALGDELLVWQDKYSRLYEAHKRVQKVNANLEDKLLKIVDKCESEKAALTSELTSTLHRLAAAEEEITRLNSENERYRNDVNLAIQLLQCKPANFVTQRYDTLPADLQQKVKRYVNSTTTKRRPSVPPTNSGATSGRTIRVPISTFPPTAMVFSVTERDSIDTNASSNSDESSSGGGNEGISAAVLARVLEERQRERLTRRKHCDSCTCISATTPTTEASSTPSETAEARYRHRHRFVDFITASAPQSTESTTMRNVKCIYTTSSSSTNNSASRRTKAKSMNDQDDHKGGNLLLEGTVDFPSTPLIHNPRSRSTSSTSSCEERQFSTPAETEI